jgi:hypothetical protein
MKKFLMVGMLFCASAYAGGDDEKKPQDPTLSDVVNHNTVNSF